MHNLQPVPNYYINETLQIKVLSLNLTGNITITFCLPVEKQKIENVTKMLKAEDVLLICTKNKPFLVDYKIPRMNITTSKIYNSKSLVSAASLIVSIDQNKVKYFQINEIANISVNECGINVKNENEKVVNRRFPPIEIPEFYLNEPFLFFIYDTVENVILYTGEVYNPLE